jgi:hypothetical protein
MCYMCQGDLEILVICNMIRMFSNNLSEMPSAQTKLTSYDMIRSNSILSLKQWRLVTISTGTADSLVFFLNAQSCRRICSIFI